MKRMIILLALALMAGACSSRVEYVVELEDGRIEELSVDRASLLTEVVSVGDTLTVKACDDYKGVDLYGLYRDRLPNDYHKMYGGKHYHYSYHRAVVRKLRK